MNKIGLFTFLVAVFLVFLFRFQSETAVTSPSPTSLKKTEASIAMSMPRLETAASDAAANLRNQTSLPPLATASSANLMAVKPEGLAKPQIKSSEPAALHFRVDEDGLATADGDIVLGEAPEDVTSGLTKAPEIHLWPQGRVPFFIQGDLENKERIFQAMAKFTDTPIRLVPYQGEEDVLVFQNTTSGCKSYLGKIGGKQPIWISADCQPTEIAHEIMHALGFIHEQNRSDRDAFIAVHLDNVLESAKINFEVFPSSLMSVSGLGPFDFRSLMIYSERAFSKNGQNTISSKLDREVIAPDSTLSPGDLQRLYQAYGK